MARKKKIQKEQMSLKPIISCDVSDHRILDGRATCWTVHKTAKFKSIHGTISVNGTILLQSLRRSRIRFLVVDNSIQRLGSTGSTLKQFPGLHVYCLTKNRTKFLDEIRAHRAIYLGELRDTEENQFSLGTLSLEAGSIRQLTSIVVVMEHRQFEPEALVAYGDLATGHRTEDSKQGKSQAVGGDSSDFAHFRNQSSMNDVSTAVQSLKIDEPIKETTLQRYAAVAQSIIKNLGVAESKKIDFEAFKRGLDSVDMVVLEHRALSLFRSCDEHNFGSLTSYDLELCLMVNDACPAISNGSTNLYEIFSSYDVDKVATLTFNQFQECLSTPGIKIGSTLRNMGVLQYMFQKFATGGRIDYPSFVKLWSKYLVDPSYEIQKRNVKEDLKISQRILEAALPFLRARRRKAILYDLVKDESYRNAMHFIEVKQRIIHLRKETQSNSDEVRRSAKKLGRKQKIESRIDISHKGKTKNNFILNRRKEMYLRNRRYAIGKISSDCALRAKEQLVSSILEKKEKNAMEAEIIRESHGDRLRLSNVGLVEIPRDLYEDRNSQMKLMDIKVMDFSQNVLRTLPRSGFFFHLVSMRKLCLSRNDLRELPHGIESMKRLEILLLDHNCIEFLPSSVCKLENLQVIDISFNKIYIISSEFCLLHKIKVLEAHSNRIASLPQDIGRFQNLELLDLSNNKLSTLPSSICSLSKLFKMNLASNHLLDLPVMFGDLMHLVELDVSNNELKVCKRYTKY